MNLFVRRIRSGRSARHRLPSRRDYERLVLGARGRTNAADIAVWSRICPSSARASEQGPFEMDRAADAVAELIRSRVGTGRAHVVGLSLGAQVGGAAGWRREPQTRRPGGACGTCRQHAAGYHARRERLAGAGRPERTWFRRVIHRRWNCADAAIPRGQGQ